MVDNRELKIQLHQLVLGLISGIVSFAIIIGMAALWVNSQLSILSERVATQTTTIQKLSDANLELYRMWAEHEAKLQVLDTKVADLRKPHE